MKERERHGLPHLSVRAIKKLIALGLSDKDIGNRFGISRRHVNSIRNGVVYDHVSMEGLTDEETARVEIAAGLRRQDDETA